MFALALNKFHRLGYYFTKPSSKNNIKLKLTPWIKLQLILLLLDI